MDERLKGRRRMRFVGRKDGRLIPKAPGSYEQGEIYLMPPRQANYPWWELIEELPLDEISKDAPEESVYEEEKEEVTEEEITGVDTKEKTMRPLKDLVKRELIEYLHSTGTKASLSMRKRELQRLASERGYPSS